MKTSSLLWGITVSLFAGVGLGILVAPRSGTRTWRKLLSKGEDNIEAIRSEYNNIVEAISDRYEDQVRAVETLVRKEKRDSRRVAVTDLQRDGHTGL